MKIFVYGFRRWFLNGFRRGKERFCMVSVVFLLVLSFFYGFRLLQDCRCLSDGNRKKTTTSGRFRDELSVYIYIYIYICIIHIYIYIHTHMHLALALHGGQEL